MFKMGCEIFSNCAKLSSALVPRIKNDHSLNSAKKTSGPVPVDKLKLVAESCYKEISYHINNAIDENIFPDNLKKADVSPIFKIGDSHIKKEL